jgi:hypothetical protein
MAMLQLSSKWRYVYAVFDAEAAGREVTVVGGKASQLSALAVAI